MGLIVKYRFVPTALVLWLLTASAAHGQTCGSADFDGDDDVDVIDLIDVILNWGATRPTSGDANADGIVDVEDLVVVVLCFGHLPRAEPEGFVRDLPNMGGTFENIFFTPTVADTDGDGVHEIYANRADGRLYGLDADGNDLPGFPADLTVLAGGGVADAAADHVPAVADLDGDGIQEIVTSVRLSGADETRLFAITQDGLVHDSWPREGAVLAPIVGASPTVADLDDDGALEVIVCSGQIPSGPVLHVLSADGVPINDHFPLIWPDGFSNIGSAAVGDVDMDGYKEIAFLGGDFMVHVINHEDASEVPGWPVPVDGFRSSVVVGDLDGDGALDIVVAEDCSSDGRVSAFAADGTLLPGWPIAFGALGVYLNSPALADVDGDGSLEVVFQTVAQVEEGQYAAVVAVLGATGEYLPGWPQIVDDIGNSITNVTISDLDGDGAKDLAYVSEIGTLYAWHADGTLIDGLPLVNEIDGLETNCLSTVAICDLKGDGDPELVFSLFFNAGFGDPPEYHFAQIQSIDLDGIFGPAGWRQWHGDDRHTGLAQE